MEASLHHIAVPRSARYALLGEAGPEVSELWVVLHGYRQLAPRFIRRFRGLLQPSRLIVAPEALNRFYVGDAPGRHGPEAKVGGTWMTREDRESEIRDYVSYLDILHDHLQAQLPEPVPCRVLGFSQGCHTAARWTAYGRVKAADLILWGEVLPGDLDLERARTGWAETRVTSVQGREDRHITPDLLEKQAAQAAAAEVPMELVWHDEGHVLRGETLQSVVSGLRTPR